MHVWFFKAFTLDSKVLHNYLIPFFVRSFGYMHVDRVENVREEFHTWMKLRFCFMFKRTMNGEGKKC